MASGGLTRSKLKYIIDRVKTANEVRARTYYDEIYGAVPSDNIPVERVRQSVIEGARSLLGED